MKLELDVYFSEENITGLLPVHSPFHTLKVTDIPLKTNRCNTKIKSKIESAFV